MKYYITTLLILITFSFSFGQFTTQKGGHCYTLDVPDYLTKTFQLNDVASLQYVNSAKEAYIIVIEDSKYHLNEVSMKFVDSEDFLKNFIAEYQVGTAEREVGEIRKYESNGLGHAQVEMSWGAGQEKLYMLITTVESDEYFYKILCWTIYDYKDQYRDDYLKVAASLKE